MADKDLQDQYEDDFDSNDSEYFDEFDDAGASVDDGDWDEMDDDVDGDYQQPAPQKKKKFFPDLSYHRGCCSRWWCFCYFPNGWR